MNILKMFYNEITKTAEREFIQLEEKFNMNIKQLLFEFKQGFSEIVVRLKNDIEKSYIDVNFNPLRHFKLEIYDSIYLLPENFVITTEGVNESTSDFHSVNITTGSGNDSILNKLNL